MPIIEGQGEDLSEELKRELGFEKKSLFRRAAEFIAPTATGLLTGEKELGVKTGLGAVLEASALAVPPARIAGIGARVAPRLFGSAQRAIQPEAVGVAQKAGRFARRLGAGAVKTAITGGITGAALGAGQELGEEDAGVKEVLGRAAQFAIAGTFAGAVLAPTLSISGAVTKGTVNFVSKSVKNIYNSINPESKELAINGLEDAYYNGFVRDNRSVIDKMEKLFGLDVRQGIRKLAENGYIPTIEGATARMKPTIDSLKDTIGTTAQVLDEYLGNFRTKTSMDQLRGVAASKLKGRTDVDLVKTTRDLNQFIKAIQTKYGKTVSAQTLRKIEIEAGKRSRAFAKAEKFVQDAANSVSQATDEILTTIGGSQYKLFKGELQELILMRQTASIINNQTAKVGFLGEAMGRFLGTFGGAAAGLQVAGAGGLVVAGVLANLGSKSVAQLVRLSRFNPQFKEIIEQGLTHDKKVLNSLLRKATPEDRVLIEQASKAVQKRLKTEVKARQ